MDRRLRFRLTIVLAVCLFVSLFCILYPLYVIRPFRAQGSRELMFALALTRIRFAIAFLSAVIAGAAALAYWRGTSSRWGRRLAVGSAALCVVLSGLTQANVFELMFPPIDRPAFASAAETKLDPEEKVIAVKIGRKARAYPVRGLAYHHIVNDEVDKKAIVGTY